MDFDESLILKNSQPTTKNEDGMIFELFVVPKHPKDFHVYINACRGRTTWITDETAKKYSTDNQFMLCWIWGIIGDIGYDIVK